MPRGKRFFWLKRPKLRQSWNKFNLYNLSRARNPIYQGQTYFQQKWMSKSLSRAYHGETINEKHWERMFRSTIKSVVPMDPTYLAQNDGSEFAAGRGSGLDIEPGTKAKQRYRTPYMNMVYAPTERRLDTAIFRALFASSTRQARQFVVHGYVKVNGKRMVYPAYQLNPGDMFQVESERVLYATGAAKDSSERRAGRIAKRIQAEASSDPSKANSELTTTESTHPASQDPAAALSTLRDQVDSILSNTSSPEHKRSLRSFQTTLRRVVTQPSSAGTSLNDALDNQLQQLMQSLNLRTDITLPTPAGATSATILARDDERRLRQALAVARTNPIDPTKPYATPWRPRPYLSAFAFVPRYLEVHHAICSAVYLRHPVARPALAEVPTPFPQEMNGLAFNWYLRRR